MSVFYARRRTLGLTVGGLLMAVNILLASFSIPVPGGHFYLNDAVIVAAALLFRPTTAFLIGGVGAFLGDFFFYPPPMFVSLAAHGLQALIISFVYRHVSKRHKTAGTLSGVVMGGACMVLIYSLGRAYIYATPEYAVIKLPWEILQALTGSLIGLAIARQPFWRSMAQALW